MKRREFLSLYGLATGSCLVPHAFARVVRDVCMLAGRPCLTAPPDPQLILSAIAMEGEGKPPYMFCIGDPRDAPEPISKLEYLEVYEGVDTDDPHAVREFCLDNYGEPEGETLEQFLARPVTGADATHWELWWERHECPSVIAHDLLNSLPLDDGRGAPSREPLASLVFEEGEWFGAWCYRVEAPSLAAVACLQNRLNELDQNIAIRIENW